MYSSVLANCKANLFGPLSLIHSEDQKVDFLLKTLLPAPVLFKTYMLLQESMNLESLNLTHKFFPHKRSLKSQAWMCVSHCLMWHKYGNVKCMSWVIVWWFPWRFDIKCQKKCLILGLSSVTQIIVIHGWVSELPEGSCKNQWIQDILQDKETLQQIFKKYWPTSFEPQDLKAKHRLNYSENHSLAVKFATPRAACEFWGKKTPVGKDSP